jgi:hypothetical protein
MDILSSEWQTKIWRKAQEWYKNGKSTECEVYQRNKLQEIIGKKILKSSKRFNKEKNLFQDMLRPNMRDDGFEWTENMDGQCNYNNTQYYYNFKMICEGGGSQTRSLREVYEFIKSQLNWLVENNEESIIFINILDGHESFKHKNKFNYLINNKNYENIKHKVFIGDLLEFKQKYHETQ